MTDSKVSLRYASSLLGLSVEKKILDTVSGDMEFLKSAIMQNAPLRNLLESPVVKSHVKISIIEEVLSKSNPDTKKFIRFVIGKNRENLLYTIAAKFLELRDEHLGLINVFVKTAHEFSEEQKKRLKDKLEKMLNKKVSFNFQIDKSLVGGFIAQVNDTVYDASLKHQIELLRLQLLENKSFLVQKN